jgi:hypothetical protein
MGIQGRRRKHLLADLEEKRGYWKSEKRRHWIAFCGELALE